MSEAPSILVVGAGSIGRRHAGNLVAAGARVSICDLDPSRAEQVAAATGAAAVALDVEAMVGADGVAPSGILVASPTSLHRLHAESALASGARVLVEKPLAMDPGDAAAVAAAGGDRLAVAYNLRFHRPVQRIAELLADGAAGQLSSLRLWFGSWLPDWRPGTDYRASYSARTDLGGGVLLDAIHELDLIVWLLGDAPLGVVGAIVEQLGPLGIETEDTVKALLRTGDGVAVELSLDYLARRYRRGLEATGDRATVRLDWSRALIEVEDADGRRVEPADASVDLSYEAQDRAFVDWVTGGPALPVDGTTGVRSVELAARIREAAG